MSLRTPTGNVVASFWRATAGFVGLGAQLPAGLLSMDIVDLEVLIRSGNPQEQQRAKMIVPLVKNAHYLLVTLLLCNAAAMETLPLFLDKMVHESVAIIISVTAVLLFGEIIPQAVCSKHGLFIGAVMAWPVRILMIITAPISWPLSKVLDRVLGGDHASLFRRKQLKALVAIHAKDEGFGGKLTPEEIQVITGAMDLTTKIAYTAMTALDKVFMLSNAQKLDDATVEAIMSAKPYSRVPVYRGDNRQDIIGLILVKELLEYVKRFPDSPVSNLKIRPLPRLSASTPMYDMLKIFRTGRSHMALLTQPILPHEFSAAGSTLSSLLPVGKQSAGHDFLLGAGHAKSHEHTAFAAPLGSHALQQAAALGLDEDQMIASSAAHGGADVQKPEAERSLYGAGTGPGHHQHHHQPTLHQHKHHAAVALGHPVSRTASSPAKFGHHTALCCTPGLSAGIVGGSASSSCRDHEQEPSAAALSAVGSIDESAVLIDTEHGSAELCSTLHVAAGSVTSKVSRSRSAITSIKRFFRGQAVDASDGSHLAEVNGFSGRQRKSGSTSTSRSHSGDLDDLLPVPRIAFPGEPIGIITIEDVLEELMQLEIVDELDKFVDNEQSVLVADAKLERDLPDNLKTVLTEAARAQQSAQLPSEPPSLATGSMLSNIITSVLRPSQSGTPQPGAPSPGLFKLSRQGSRPRDAVELAPLLEDAPFQHGTKTMPVEAAGNTALAAALLVAAGKRVPGAAAPRLQGHPLGKRSQELFSYLGPVVQHQQQQGLTPALRPSAQGTKP